MNTGAPWPDLGEAGRRVRVMQTQADHKWHEHMESRMQWKLHVRFGGRAGETHQPQGRKGAPVRPLHLCSDLVGLSVYSVRCRRLFAVHRRLASVEQSTNRPGSRRPRASTLARRPDTASPEGTNRRLLSHLRYQTLDWADDDRQLAYVVGGEYLGTRRTPAGLLCCRC